MAYINCFILQFVYAKVLIKEGNLVAISEILFPNSIDEAKQYLNKYSNAKILAGGTDLVIEMRKGKVTADYLISLSKINDLKRIKNFPHHIVFGSMVTFTDLLETEILNNYYGAVKDSADSMGSPQIRNIATIGGNMANAAAAADIIPCLLCLDASINIEGQNSHRIIKACEYFRSYKDFKVKENEIIKEISIVKNTGSSGFYKLGKRNSLSISRLNAAVYIDAENNKVKNFRVVLGAVGRLPFRVSELEKIVPGNDIDYIFNDEVLNILEKKVFESINGRKTMPFKKEAVKGVYKEAARRAANRAGITLG